MRNNKLNQEVFVRELKIRRLIREVIGFHKQRNKYLQEQQENKLRFAIRTIIKEQFLNEAREDRPHHSTGINVLADDLRKIIPVLEIDYKKITTNEKQRQSFRAHIINAAKNVMSAENLEDEADVGVKVDDQADVDGSVESGGDSGEIRELDINPDPSTPPDPDQAKFIDVDRPSQKKKQKEQKPEDTFTLPGEDVTGRNMAMQTFKKIEKTIAEGYGNLSDPEDKRLYYDYMLANLRLWFDRFSEELAGEIAEPDTSIPGEEETLGSQQPSPTGQANPKLSAQPTGQPTRGL